ncbi:MAG: hypothetical protein ACREDR_15430 [Blastocatellia bacterium]
MRIAHGKVIAGQILVEGEPLSEGATVTILAPEAPTFALSDEDENALLTAIAEADHGRLVDSDEVLTRLP